MPKLSATSAYLAISGISGFLFQAVFAVNLVYQVQTVGLSPLQLTLVGMVLEVVVFCCQVPTGMLADVYSRKLSVMLGFLLIGIGMMLEGSVPHFTAVLLAQVIWGLGITFTDGAKQAWLSDEVGEARAAREFLRGQQVAQVGGLLGIVAGVALANFRLNLPIVAGGAAFMLLAAFLGMVMPEQPLATFGHHTSAERGPSPGHMMRLLHAGIRVARRPLLLTLLAVGVSYGMFSEGIDRLSTPHWLHDLALPQLGRLKPVTWFGVFSLSGTLLTLAGTELARRKLDLDDPAVVGRALFAITAALVACALTFALTTSFPFALAAFLMITALRGTGGPIYTAWYNRRCETGVRATVLSMAGQANALGQIVGGPLVGAIGTVASVRIALAVSGILLTPAVLLYGSATRREGAEAPSPQLVEKV